MADATYAIPNFLGGERSQFAQGRFDQPDYRVSMQVCLNAFPNEIGTLIRRPGTQYGGHSRAGAPGRTLKFDFEQSNAITLEFSDGFVRFRSGATLITTNDEQVVVAVSNANPAVVQTTAAVTWATGDTLVFPGAATPLLENRQFVATKIDTSHFSLVDALTGATIDGSTLGALVAGATVAKLHELTTAYTSGSWSAIRAVQAETTDILLTPGVTPQALTVATLPSTGVNPVFAIASAILNDGPYLDPFTNGVQAVPASKSGIVSITLTFPTYNATTAYAAGSFVNSSSVNYRSLVDQNVGNTPASSPSQWAAVSAGAAINNGNGLLGTDIGRLVRLFSEPVLWLVTATHVIGDVVSYNPSGAPGAATYWQSLTSSNTGNAPGSDLTNWELVPQGAAIWTWGKITALLNIISPTLVNSAAIGSMTTGGGINAAFDSVFVKTAATSAQGFTSGAGQNPGATFTFASYVGKVYSVTSQKIQSATVYPSSDSGFSSGTYTVAGVTLFFQPVVTLNLRAKASAPTSSSDGTLLGTTGPITSAAGPQTILSSDQNTAWPYVWIEQVTAFQNQSSIASSGYDLFNQIAQVSFFSPSGTGTGSGFSLEILGPPLLYTVPVLTWRLGVFSNTTGYPTCGTYHEGRLWLGGAVPNRFDGSVSNGIVGGTVNFAPTDQYGVVASSNAISEVLNSDGENPIFWMEPDLQGLLMGTQAGEWLVQAPTTGPMSPTNIAARRVTKIGCANIEPRRTDHTTVFVKRYARKLMEYFSDVYSGKFSAPNLADKAEHILRTGVAEIAYTEAVTPVLWGRCNDGSLFGITYKRDTLTTSQGPTFAAFHRHALGSGRIVESLCSGPSVGGDLDSVTLVSNDTTSNIRHVEVMTDTMDEFSPLAESWFLDDAVTPTSTSTTNVASAGAPYGGLTINGLWHLNGKTVQVFAGGLDCGDPGENKPIKDFVVTNGSCFVPYGDGISAGPGRGLFTAVFAAAGPQIVVGFTYNSDGQMVRPIAPGDTGARNGPALGKIRRNHRYAMLLSNSLGISVGASFSKMYPAIFQQANGSAIAQLTTYSGVYQNTLADDYGYDGAICWRISRPFPANIAALSGSIQTQDQ